MSHHRPSSLDQADLQIIGRYMGLVCLPDSYGAREGIYNVFYPYKWGDIKHNV